MSIVGLRSLMPPREILTSQHGTDDDWHAHYPTATRTLCNLEVLPGANATGPTPKPTCLVCLPTAIVFGGIDDSMPPHWSATATASIGRRKHGTISAYTGGCRCDDCRDAMSAYHREHRGKKTLGEAAGGRSGEAVRVAVSPSVSVESEAA